MKEHPILAAIKSVTPMATKQEIEGDSKTWHIRLVKRQKIAGDVIESWQLWNGDSPESSPTLKEFVEEWRDKELAKGKR